MSELLSVSLKPIAPSIEQTSRLTSRLQQRLAKSIADHAGLMTVRVKDGLWRELRQGVRYKLLWQGTAGNSVLIEFAPGAALPVHRHNWLEEGIVLKGGLQMDTLDLKPFDYHVSPPGSRHAAIRSKQGALAFLRGTSLGQTQAVMRELLGGILPFPGKAALTCYDDDHGWQEVCPGVLRKVLYVDGNTASCFYRIQPGGVAPRHEHGLDEECMMLDGEVFLGDILLRRGDYQLAPAGTLHGDAYSDVGALLYVRAKLEG